MEEKENVYLEKTQTETGAQAKSSAESEDAVTENSTVLGKFKDVNALAHAYSALQAEFTRRSQRLKELERVIKTQDAEKGETEKRNGKAATVVEKLRQNAASVKEEANKFDSFVAELEQAGARLGEKVDLPDELQSLQDGDRQQETENVTDRQVNSSVAHHQETVALSADKLFDEVNRNEEVRLKIIGEYLASLRKSGAPLMTGGAGTLAAPPLKAKTVKDAGNMALRFFKNGTQG